MWDRGKIFFSTQIRNPVFPWVLAFLASCLAVPQRELQPEFSRMVFFGLLGDSPNYEFARAALAFALQQIPFALLILAVATWLLTLGVSLVAVHFFALAALFGNTAALFMNNWSGHGLASVLVLGALFTLVTHRYFWSGLALGFAALADYGSVALVPALVASLFFFEPKPKNWARSLLLGLLLPAATWIWYDLSGESFAFLLGNGDTLRIAKPYPDAEVMGELLFGSSRGLLVTQPWALLLIPIALGRLAMHYSTRVQRGVLLFSFGGFFSLLALNSMYGEWFAGETAGVRYLCLILPSLAFTAGIFYDYLSRWWWRAAMWLALAASLVYRGLVYAASPEAPLEPLWPYLWRQILEKETPTNWLRLGIYWAILGIAIWWVRCRSERDQRTVATLEPNSGTR